MRTTAIGGRLQDSSSSGIAFRRTGGQYISVAPTTHPAGLHHNQPSKHSNIIGRCSKYMDQILVRLPIGSDNAVCGCIARSFVFLVSAVLSQLQQGLNYRFLQEQSLMQQQQQQQAMGVVVQPSSHMEHPQPITEQSQVCR